MKLKDKVAIITGGSRGIGKAIAKAFLQNGAMVTICARSWVEIDDTVQDLRSKGEIFGIVADISREEDVRKLAEETINRYGSVDILINTAGVQGPIGPFIEVDIQEWISNIHINLIGTILCCKYVLPIMIKKKKGKIINFSGGGATFPRPNFSAYACSKTGVVRFTEILALEVKDYEIDVNAIAPGAVNTRMLDEIIKTGEKAGERELSEAIERSKKGGDSPEMAARLAVFLASEDSNGLTGRLISAVWDDWESFDDRTIREINRSSIYTLRRIDGRNYMEKKS